MTNSSSDKQPTWKYIVDKILSWQVIFIILFFLFFNVVKQKLKESNEIKMGDFQISVNKLAESSGISNVIRDLNNLTYEELKLFLIIGGEDANYYTFSPNSLYPHPKLEEMYKDLQSNGLIEQMNPKDIPGYDKMKINASFAFKTTSKGEKIHKAVLDAIYSNLKEPKMSN